jgi:formate hydrogenlyase subunit 3/multisubunit Na+/H+ antiporter MnhD subunit
MIPGLWMIIASIFLPIIPQYFRQPLMVLSVLASALSLLNGFGVFVEWEILGNTLILYQADNLTLPFALIFHLASVLVIIYGWHNKNLMENMATLAMQVLPSVLYMQETFLAYLFGGKQPHLLQYLLYWLEIHHQQDHLPCVI